MPLLDRQITKRTQEIILESLRKGKLPGTRQILKEMRDFFERTKDGPLMRPRYQQRRRQWDVAATNEVLKEIKFDMEVAYEELVDQVGKLIRRIAFIEMSYGSQKTEIEGLIALLRNQLFVTKNADDNFAGVFDTFTDLTKVNQTVSTRDMLDLTEGVALLPATDLTGGRVDMSHLYGRSSWPITVREVGSTVPGGSVPPNLRVPSN